MLHKIESNPKINHPLACARKPNKHSHNLPLLWQVLTLALCRHLNLTTVLMRFSSLILYTCMYYLFVPSHSP